CSHNHPGGRPVRHRNPLHNHHELRAATCPRHTCWSRSNCRLCCTGSCTDHSRYSATAAVFADRDVSDRNNVAGNATDSDVVAARANAGGRKGNSAGAANPDDSDRRAVAVPVASCGSDASCCCCRGCCYRGDCCPSHGCCCRGGCCPSCDCDLDSDRVPTAGDVAAPVAAVGAAAPNAVVVPASVVFVPAAAAASDLRVRVTAGSAPAAAAGCAVAGAAAPNAAAVPGCSAVAAGVAAPSAVGVLDY